MRLLLTGATGYVGGVVGEKLLAAGHGVVGMTRKASDERALEQRGMEVVRGDLSEA